MARPDRLFDLRPRRFLPVLRGVERVGQARALLERYRDETDPSVIHLRVSLLHHERRFSEIVALEQDPLIADALHDTAPFRTSLLRSGDVERALEFAGRHVEQSVGYSKGLALWGRARLNIQIGSFRKALEDLEAAPPLYDSPVIHALGAWTQVTHALVLEMVGDLEKALRHFRTLADPPRPPGDLVFEWDIPALYEVARLEQRAGSLDEARRRYRELLKHWGDADMPVPIVERAREELAALGAS